MGYFMGIRFDYHYEKNERASELSRAPPWSGTSKGRIHLLKDYAPTSTTAKTADRFAIAAEKQDKLNRVERRYNILVKLNGTDYKINKESLRKRLGISSDEFDDFVYQHVKGGGRVDTGQFKRFIQDKLNEETFQEEVQKQAQKHLTFIRISSGEPKEIDKYILENIPKNQLRYVAKGLYDKIQIKDPNAKVRVFITDTDRYSKETNLALAKALKGQIPEDQYKLLITKRKADSKNYQAVEELTNMYLKGTSMVRKNAQMARAYLVNLAQESENGDFIYQIANLYKEKFIKPNKSDKRDIDNLAKFYEKATHKNHAEAALKLAEIYENLPDTESNKTKLILTNYLKAACLGNFEAKEKLANLMQGKANIVSDVIQGLDANFCNKILKQKDLIDKIASATGKDSKFITNSLKMIIDINK